MEIPSGAKGDTLLCRPSGALHYFLAPFPGLTPWAKSCFALRAGAVEYVNLIAPTYVPGWTSCFALWAGAVEYVNLIAQPRRILRNRAKV